jgi:DNA-binding NarL/FixJ family response regulator
LSKDARREQIKSAVRAAAAGELLWSKEQLHRVSGSLLPQQQGTAAIPLTKRENEVLKQIALGLTNKEIARALGISFETTKSTSNTFCKNLASPIAHKPQCGRFDSKWSNGTPLPANSNLE